MVEDKEKLGLLGPDEDDERDILLEKAVPLKEDYPSIIDFDKYTIISDQFYGTCVSHSSCGSSESSEGYGIGKPFKGSNKFVYIQTKHISDLWHMEGDFLRNALKACERVGMPKDSSFPDLPMSNWKEYAHTPISVELFDEALDYRIKGYARVGKTIDDFMRALWNSKNPVPVGMEWYESYRKEKADGYLPPADGKRTGGHAIRFSKIDFTEEKIWFPNSWGRRWGNDGYFYIPFKEFNKHNFWDCWAITPLDNSKAKAMKQRYIDDKNRQYVKNGNAYYRLPDDSTLHLLLVFEWVTESVKQLPEGTTIKEFPMSKKLYDFIKKGKDVFEDIYDINV